MESKFYSTPTSNDVLKFLVDHNYEQREEGVDDVNEELIFIINTDEKIFWVSDQTNLSFAKEIAKEEYNQQILQTDFNTISSWQI